MSIFTLNAANIFNILNGGSPLSIIASILKPSYEINSDDDSSISLSFDGMVSINPSGGASVINAPVEDGKYQSINKVKEPSRVNCIVVINGLTGYTGYIPNILEGSLVSQSSVLKTIKKMIDETHTYTITTPKETLESYDLVHWEYSVTATEGVTLLKVSLVFEEIMQVMEVTLNSSSPTNNSNSMVVPSVPTTEYLINGNKALQSAWDAVASSCGISSLGGGWGVI